ncbi:MAG: hypothetical protein KDJ28_09475 [Candidatus Competibacteraceae bacterium]|nr:hypothetical protein [Candidatus Competibacteraceae bacterium]
MVFKGFFRRSTPFIIEQCASGGAGELPDGLENLRRHNLLTYKSQREAMDGWAFDELL